MAQPAQTNGHGAGQPLDVKVLGMNSGTSMVSGQTAGRVKKEASRAAREVC